MRFIFYFSEIIIITSNGLYIYTILFLCPIEGTTAILYPYSIHILPYLSKSIDLFKDIKKAIPFIDIAFLTCFVLFSFCVALVNRHRMQFCANQQERIWFISVPSSRLKFVFAALVKGHRMQFCANFVGTYLRGLVTDDVRFIIYIYYSYKIHTLSILYPYSIHTLSIHYPYTIPTSDPS
jgi:hypothetical protein